MKDGSDIFEYVVCTSSRCNCLDQLLFNITQYMTVCVHAPIISSPRLMFSSTFCVTE